MTQNDELWKKQSKQHFVKMKNSCPLKDTVKKRKWKSNPKTGGKYLQSQFIIKDLYPEYIENSDRQ